MRQESGTDEQADYVIGRESTCGGKRFIRRIKVDRSVSGERSYLKLDIPDLAKLEYDEFSYRGAWCVVPWMLNSMNLCSISAKR
jgi:hypothetical protein